MPDQPEFKSIADVLASAQQKRSAATAKPVIKRRFTAPVAPARPAATAPGKAAAPAASPNDIRDDFDYAIEFVETARKALPNDPVKAETMATSLLMAKRQIARAEATDLVKRAIHYLRR